MALLPRGLDVSAYNTDTWAVCQVCEQDLRHAKGQTRGHYCFKCGSPWPLFDAEVFRRIGICQALDEIYSSKAGIQEVRSITVELHSGRQSRPKLH